MAFLKTVLSIVPRDPFAQPIGFLIEELHLIWKLNSYLLGVGHLMQSGIKLKESYLSYVIPEGKANWQGPSVETWKTIPAGVKLLPAFPHRDSTLVVSETANLIDWRRRGKPHPDTPLEQLNITIYFYIEMGSYIARCLDSYTLI